jgi:TonB family protein
MKKIILVLTTVLFIGSTAFAEDSDKGLNKSDKKYNQKEVIYITDTNTSSPLRFELNGRYERPIKKEKLNECRSLGDIIAYYPVNWITSYDSVEILATCNGKAMRAVSPNDILSTEQKNILKTIDLGADLFINVRYKFLNSFNNYILENNKIHIKMTVVPEIEAEYVGGYGQMIKYLEENVINKISETIPKQFEKSVVIFTVNEQGETTEANISMSSGDAKTDKLLLDAINKMPKWKPAENSTGINVKQEFIFYVRNGNGGC